MTNPERSLPDEGARNEDANALHSFEELPRKQVTATLVGVMIALFMAALDQTIVGTAMPRIISDLQGFDLYAWTVTAYLLTSTAIVPIAGKIGDLYGRKALLLIGVAVFILASILCGVAQSMLQLIAFRGAQGMGAGLTFSMAFTTIADLFPPARRARVTGLFGAVFGLASILGPAAGGFLTDGPGWRWVFYVNVPIGLVAIGALVFFYPRVRPRHARPVIIDFPGGLALTLVVVPLLLALSWGGHEYAWSSLPILGLLVLSVVMAAVFVLIERRAAEPIIPLSLFKNPIVAVIIAATMLTSAGMYGTLLFIPLFIQAVLGTSATQSGAVLTPMMLSMVVSSIGAGQILARVGKYRYLAIGGVAIATLGMGLLAIMDADVTYPTIVRNVIIIGFGLGVTMPIFPLAVQNAVPHEIVGVASATSQFFRSMGGALGSAVFGALLANRFAPLFHAALPTEVVRAVPAAILRRFENPQALLNPETASSLQNLISVPGPQGQADAQMVMQAIRTALASSIHDVFVVSTAIMIAATIVLLLLRDIPLRQSNRSAARPARG
jgi:EmrB/QacA subfamily drug resistance transporter